MRPSDDRPEVGDEASGQDRLAILGFVEAEFEHHGIDDGHRSRRHRNPGKPTRHHRPSQKIMGGCRASQKWKKEACEPDRGCFLPFELEHLGVEFGARQKRQHDRADAGQELDPGLIGAEHGGANDGANDQLRDGSNNDFRKRRRDTEPDRKQARDERETEPQGRERPNASHESSYRLREAERGRRARLAQGRPRPGPPGNGMRKTAVKPRLLADTQQNSCLSLAAESSANSAISGDPIPIWRHNSKREWSNGKAGHANANKLDLR